MEIVNPAQVEIWRQKVRDGTISIEELRAAVKTLRDGRMSVSSTATKSRAPKREVSQAETNAILDEFEKLL